MKKLLSFLVCVCMYANTHAQSNFAKYLAHFKESKMPFQVSSKGFEKKLIDKNLAWQFAYEESPYTKPEKAFVLPFVYYKISADVAVLLTASALDETPDAIYSVRLQTYNIKKGKLIDQVRVLYAQFGGTQSMICDADVDAKGILKLTTMSFSARIERFEISSRGKIKELD